MANYGFGITPNQLFKVVSTSNIPWNNDQRLNCFIADGIANLNDDKAKAQFVHTLNSLGIRPISEPIRFADNIVVEVFGNTKKPKKLTADDKRKAIALSIVNDESQYQMFMHVEGEALERLYESQVKPNRDSNPFVLYRITLGEHLVYRITNDNESPAEVANKAIDYVIRQRKADPAQFDLTAIEAALTGKELSQPSQTPEESQEIEAEVEANPA